MAEQETVYRLTRFNLVRLARITAYRVWRFDDRELGDWIEGHLQRRGLTPEPVVEAADQADYSFSSDMLCFWIEEIAREALDLSSYGNYLDGPQLAELETVIIDRIDAEKGPQPCSVDVDEPPPSDGEIAVSRERLREALGQAWGCGCETCMDSLDTAVSAVFADLNKGPRP